MATVEPFEVRKLPASLTAVASPEFLSWGELPVWVLDTVISTWPADVSRREFVGASLLMDPAEGPYYFLHFREDVSAVVLRDRSRMLYRRRSTIGRIS